MIDYLTVSIAFIFIPAALIVFVYRVGRRVDDVEAVQEDRNQWRSKYNTQRKIAEANEAEIATLSDHLAASRAETADLRDRIAKAQSLFADLGA